MSQKQNYSIMNIKRLFSNLLPAFVFTNGNPCKHNTYKDHFHYGGRCCEKAEQRQLVHCKGISADMDIYIPGMWNFRLRHGQTVFNVVRVKEYQNGENKE